MKRHRVFGAGHPRRPERNWQPVGLPILLPVQRLNQRMIAVDPVLINAAIAVTNAVHPFEAQRHIAVRTRCNPANEDRIGATRVVGHFQPEIRNVAQQFMQRANVGFHALQRRLQSRPISFNIRREFVARLAEIRRGRSLHRLGRRDAAPQRAPAPSDGQPGAGRDNNWPDFTSHAYTKIRIQKAPQFGGPLSFNPGAHDKTSIAAPLPGH
jgi:hypothetical protein